MTEYECSIDVDAPADLVYEFVSNPDNMPRYLPHVQEAFADGSDRVQLLGAGFDAEANLHLDPDERTMHWNSASHESYRGQLQVAAAERGCRLAVHLAFDQEEAEVIERRHHEGIDTELAKALEDIQHACEAQASKARTAHDDRRYMS